MKTLCTVLLNTYKRKNSPFNAEVKVQFILAQNYAKGTMELIWVFTVQQTQKFLTYCGKNSIIYCP